jgi:5-formyltetrahydrofolate cyclo-ligase
MTKSEIRCSLSAIRDNMLLEDKLSADKKLRDMLYGTQVYQRSMIYFALFLLDQRLIHMSNIEHSLSIGKRVYIPRIEPHGMEFYQIQGRKRSVTSKYGIRSQGRMWINYI